VILINILSNVTSCEEIADAIAAYIHNRTRDTRSRSPLQVVVRLVGPEVEAAKERLAAVQVSLFDSIDEAVEQAVSLARPVGKNT
jgi:succinyl-CoA synthetase beta subunit